MDTLDALADGARAELTDHILPYWANRAVDAEHGGFVGRIDGHDRLVRGAPKGSVLNARILWTFASACRVLGTDRWCNEADRAYEALRGSFRDPVHGGVFWSVAPDGTPVDPKKQVYAQAFTIYALAEHVRQRGGDAEEALAWAQGLYGVIEEHAVDPVHGGYIEAFARAWTPLADVRLSEKDADAPKSMNTHLHVLEAYTTLYRVWPDAGLAARLRALIELFLDRVIDAETGHLGCFFGMDWAPASAVVSYGHDIEASWLLDEAAAVLGDSSLTDRVREASLRIARLTLDALDADGGVFNERDGDHLDTDKHWWPQAEAVVGFLNAFERSGDAAFAEAATQTWRFIQSTVVDREGGEWFFRVARDGTPYREEDKVGPWKCPYHNARACLEILERADASVSA